MGRELNFRVWDIEREEYLSGGHVLLAIPPGRGERQTTLFLDLFEGDGDRYKERFEIEQFTGLFDKNGKEIYEGDICRFNVADGRPQEKAMNNQVGVVGFNGGVYNFGGWSLVWVTDRVVIGNVHENPFILG